MQSPQRGVLYDYHTTDDICTMPTLMRRQQQSRGWTPYRKRVSTTSQPRMFACVDAMTDLRRQSISPLCPLSSAMFQQRPRRLRRQTARSKAFLKSEPQHRPRSPSMATCLPQATRGRLPAAQGYDAKSLFCCTCTLRATRLRQNGLTVCLCC